MSNTETQSPAKSVKIFSGPQGSVKSSSSIRVEVGLILESKKANKRYKIIEIIDDRVLLESLDRSKILYCKVKTLYRYYNGERPEPVTKPRVEEDFKFKQAFQAIGAQFLNIRKDISEVEYNLTDRLDKTEARLNDLLANIQAKVDSFHDELF